MHHINVIKHLNHRFSPVPHNRWHSTPLHHKILDLYVPHMFDIIYDIQRKKKKKKLKQFKSDCLFSIVVHIMSHNISGPIFISTEIHFLPVNFILRYNRRSQIQFRSVAVLRGCWIALSWETFSNKQIEAGKYVSISLVLHSGNMAFIWCGQQKRYMTNSIVSWSPSVKTNLSSYLFWILLYI